MTGVHAPEQAYGQLLEQTRALVASEPALCAFVGDALEGLDLRPTAPRSLPVIPQITACTARTTALTAPLTETIRAVAPMLHWKQSYTEAQVGAHHLANYGWFNLVSPEGPYVNADMRVSVGYWAQGLIYPGHRHLPEEIYCVLAGGGRFETEGRAPVEAGPGTLVHHPSNILHGMDLHSEPLLAMAFWTGEALLRVSDLESTA